MGLKLSRVGVERAESLDLVHVQHQLINYLSRSFYIRNMVSKQRRRMLVGGYDLDMSYITNRILAMSFPAERMRSIYRNPMWQVKNVLEMRHKGHYKVYNLCIEESYDPSHFHGRVEAFPFDDNHVPPLKIMKKFCESVSSWLSSDPENIAVVHCMVKPQLVTDSFSKAGLELGSPSKHLASLLMQPLPYSCSASTLVESVVAI